MQLAYQDGSVRLFDAQQRQHHDMEDENGCDDLGEDDKPHLQSTQQGSGQEESLCGAANASFHGDSLFLSMLADGAVKSTFSSCNARRKHQPHWFITMPHKAGSDKGWKVAVARRFPSSRKSCHHLRPNER